EGQAQLGLRLGIAPLAEREVAAMETRAEIVHDRHALYYALVPSSRSSYARAMSTAALLLVLGAALMHAGWHALAKRGKDPLAFLCCAGCVGSLLFLPGTLFMLSAGLPWDALPFVVGTVLIHAVYFFALGRAYRLGDLSIVYPMARGTGVALAAT